MPPRDSLVPEKTEAEESDEIVTPIEAGAQEQAEREFETQRKIPAKCKTAIMSVNGKDVNEVPLPRHERAA